MPVAIVTDSTASLPPELAAERGIVVVPLQVVIGATVYDEGADGATPELVAAALKEWRPVSTSRPGPAALLEVYEQAAATGATEIVSVHLSGDMSGTFESAQLAARDASVRVLAGRHPPGRGGDRVRRARGRRRRRRRGIGEEAAAAARARAAASSSLFYVDTLEYLRRGGRIGAAAALLGGALSVKPLLQIEDGKVASLERVRTSARALARLEELAVQRGRRRTRSTSASPTWPTPTAPAQLTEKLAQRLAANLDGREVWCGELGAVLGAHVGPGMIAVCVAPRS